MPSSPRPRDGHELISLQANIYVPCFKSSHVKGVSGLCMASLGAVRRAVWVSVEQQESSHAPDLMAYSQI